ncbi:unnamed protein product [Lactuca virosa]|uniref:Uncharacterized protein n=1 Tax=Lactuca virosa TaxID=75947 RepID=A0AAU9PLR4_9ASTR|nr:unnamed protein product [Lactuca virosa]
MDRNPPPQCLTGADNDQKIPVLKLPASTCSTPQLQIQNTGRRTFRPYCCRICTPERGEIRSHFNDIFLISLFLRFLIIIVDELLVFSLNRKLSSAASC